MKVEDNRHNDKRTHRYQTNRHMHKHKSTNNGNRITEPFNEDQAYRYRKQVGI